jgi:hypothetical protein
MATAGPDNALTHPSSAFVRQNCSHEGVLLIAIALLTAANSITLLSPEVRQLGFDDIAALTVFQPLPKNKKVLHRWQSLATHAE